MPQLRRDDGLGLQGVGVSGVGTRVIGSRVEGVGMGASAVVFQDLGLERPRRTASMHFAQRCGRIRRSKGCRLTSAHA